MPRENKKLADYFILMLLVGMTSSCAVKTGNYGFPDGPLKNNLHSGFGRYWEVEVYTPQMFHERMDLSFGVGKLIGKSKGELPTTSGTTFAFKTDVLEYRTTARYYPLTLDRNNTFIPYISGGVGWYRLFTTDQSAGRRVAADNCPFGFDCFEIVESKTTLASGAFPYIGGGVHVGNESPGGGCSSKDVMILAERTMALTWEDIS